VSEEYVLKSLKIKWNRLRLLAVLVVPAMVLTACSSTSSSTSSPAPTATPTSSSSSGGKSASVTIGVAAITESSPVVPEEIATIQQGAKLLGWKTVVLNANGDPAEMASDMSALVNENVNIIYDLAIQPSDAQQGMEAAKAKGIPVIEIGAPVIDPNHLTAVTYAPSDAHMANLLAAQMIKDYPNGAKALNLADSSIPAINIRSQTLLKDTKGTGIQVASTHQVDLSNPVTDTDTAVADALHANPSINMIWALQDFEFSASVQTIKSQHLGNVGVFAFYLDPVDFGILRSMKGTETKAAVVDSPIQFSPWYALDATVNKFILKKSNWITSQSIKPLPYALVTPNNVQATGDTYPYPSFEPFFVQRWKAEGVKVNQ
jgi:ABC-type sugar transport system substrate-binding protein